MSRALADLEVVAVKLLKTSLQSLCAGAMTSAGVRHEYHHPLLPLVGCLLLACEVGSAHSAQCTLQRQTWYSGKLSMVWSTRASVKRSLTPSKGEGPENSRVCWASAANLLIIASCVGNQRCVRLSARGLIARRLFTVAQGCHVSVLDLPASSAPAICHDSLRILAGSSC